MQYIIVPVATVKETKQQQTKSQNQLTTTWAARNEQRAFIWSPRSYSWVFWITLRTSRSRNRYFPRLTKANCIYKAYTRWYQFWPTTRKLYGLPHLKGTWLQRELAPYQGESHPSASGVLAGTCKIQLQSSACGRGSNFTARIAIPLHEMQETAAIVLRDQGGLLGQRFTISLVKFVTVN